jgi:hypothetical protein
MQMSIKTPPSMTYLILAKCAEMAERFPSSFVSECVWQCLRLMDLPERANERVSTVLRYYAAVGRENEILPPSKSTNSLDPLLQELDAKSRAKRAKEAAERLKAFHAKLKTEPLGKHLNLKISEGDDDLPKRIKEKAVWLRVKPNALVVSCVRDCLLAMGDPKKALVPPPTVVDYWTISHTKPRQPSPSGVDMWILRSLEGVVRRRGGPVLDTIVRLTVAEQWEATLEQILREADVITDKREFKG